METVMAKGFIRLTGKYSGDPLYIKATKITSVIPLKSMREFDRTTEGSAVYCNESKMFEDGNYMCVLESPEKVMRLIEEAEE